MYHRGHSTSNALLCGSFKDCCITRTKVMEIQGAHWRGQSQRHNSIYSSSAVQIRLQIFDISWMMISNTRSTNTTSRFSVLPPGSQVEGSMLTACLSEELGIDCQTLVSCHPTTGHKQPPAPPAPHAISGLYSHVRESRLLDCKLRQESVSREACQSWRLNLPPRPFSASSLQPPPPPPSIFCFFSPPPAPSSPPCNAVSPSIVVELSVMPGSRLSLGRPSVSKACLEEMVVSIKGC